jgi:hypothetical protein
MSDAIIVEIVRYRVYCPVCIEQKQYQASGKIWGTYPWELVQEEWYDFQVAGASGFTCIHCNTEVAIPREWILKLRGIEEPCQTQTE